SASRRICEHSDINSSFCSYFADQSTATGIYTLSLHDALPICGGRFQIGEFKTHNQMEGCCLDFVPPVDESFTTDFERAAVYGYADRKSTRLNSSHVSISYAVFCLKKKISSRQPYLFHESSAFV